MTTTSINNKVLNIGMGVFLLLLVWEISTLISDITFDILIVFNSSHSLILWSEVFVQTLVYTIGFIIGISQLKKSTTNGRIVLKKFIIAIVVILFFGIAYYGLMRESIKTEDFNSAYNSYFEYKSSNYIKQLYVSLFSFLAYLIPVIVIYAQLNKKSS